MTDMEYVLDGNDLVLMEVNEDGKNPLMRVSGDFAIMYDNSPENKVLLMHGGSESIVDARMKYASMMHSAQLQDNVRIDLAVFRLPIQDISDEVLQAINHCINNTTGMNDFLNIMEEINNRPSMRP